MEGKDRGVTKEGTLDTYFAIFREIYLQCLCIVLEPQGCHSEQNILPIHCLALLLVTLF